MFIERCQISSRHNTSSMSKDRKGACECHVHTLKQETQTVETLQTSFFTRNNLHRKNQTLLKCAMRKSNKTLFHALDSIDNLKKRLVTTIEKLLASNNNLFPEQDVLSVYSDHFKILLISTV